jgi:hypothetical protein
MDVSQKIELTVTGSNAPVLFDAGLPAKISQHIRPTPPQGSRALHSSRSTKFAHKSIHNELELSLTQLSFSATSSARPDQHIPISVILEANFPTMPARKQSVIFSPRKEAARSPQVTPRLQTSSNCVQKSLSDEDWSKSTVSKSYMVYQSLFHVDAMSATISPRPPAARTRSPSNIHSKPQSPRIARQTVEHDDNNTADCESQSRALNSSPLIGTALHAETDKRKMKRRFGSHEVGSLETSDLPEDIQRMHASFNYENTSMLSNSSPQILADVDVSHAKKVGALENRVQSAMNRSQYNKDMYQSIVTNATVGANSTLKFAFPHPSPAQLFIVSQPIIKLSETTIMPQKLKPTAPLTSASRRSHPLPGRNTDDLAASKDNLRASKIQNTSPRQKNVFVVQKDAFVLKNISKSLQVSLPSREVQQPILFNRIGPYKQQSSVHDIRAADAALTTLAATKPVQMQKTSAEHQKYHIMCNNRVPDFFLAAMHRK